MSDPTFLTELARRVHTQARASGFYDRPRNLAEKLALVHSEVSEAYEAWRDELASVESVKGVPQGWPFELIDVIIVCLDILGEAGLDVDYLMTTKLAYNETRPHLHGRNI